MKSSLLFILLITAVSACSQQIADSRRQEIVFLSVNVIPMDKEQVLENQAVVVKNGRITAIGKPGKINYSQQALVIDGKGKFIMPGLAEMHAHIPPVNDLEPMKEVLLLFALNGITTIRGMLGHPLHLELRKKTGTGEIFGPRIYTSGPSFNGQSVTSAADAEKMVKQQKEAGYDFLKLHPGLTKVTFGAIAKTAKDLNIPFAGHVSFDVGIWRSIEAGYASIDHLDGFVEGLVPGIDTMTEQQSGLFAMFSAKLADTSKIPALMVALRDHHIWVVPTQALAERWFAADIDPEVLLKKPEMDYINPDVLQNWARAKRNLKNNAQYDSAQMISFVKFRRKLISDCNKNGVGLLLGSDAPQVFNVPGFSTHQELEYMVNSGLTPYEALRSGTINVGTYFNRPQDLGIVKEGAVSDLLLLNGNPLKDIRQTSNIAGVMIGSQWLPKDYIDKELKKLVKRKN